MGNCATMCDMDRVGIRELRRNLSVYVKRVLAGETLEVTDHGLGVALLTPLLPPSDIVEQRLAAGRARAGARRYQSFSVPKGRPSNAGSEGLALERADR